MKQGVKPSAVVVTSGLGGASRNALASPWHSFDAEVWAHSFVAHVKKNPAIPTDEATMAAWFASALERGYDERIARERRKRKKVA